MIRTELYPDLSLEEEDWRRSMLELIKGLREDTYDRIEEPVSRARATRATAQSFPTGAWTKIQYNTEVFDELDEYDHVTNFQYKAKKAGYRWVSASLTSASVAWGAGRYWMAGLYKNGSIYSYGYRDEIDVSRTTYLSSPLSDLVYLEADENINIALYHNQGGAVNCHNDSLYNYFSVHRFS